MTGTMQVDVHFSAAISNILLQKTLNTGLFEKKYNYIALNWTPKQLLNNLSLENTLRTSASVTRKHTFWLLSVPGALSSYWNQYVRSNPACGAGTWQRQVTLKLCSQFGLSI